MIITSAGIEAAVEISTWSNLASTLYLFNTSSAAICAAKLEPRPAPQTNKIVALFPIIFPPLNGIKFVLQFQHLGLFQAHRFFLHFGLETPNFS